MTVKTGSAWAGTFVCLDSTGALAAGTPAGALYIDGVANGAMVTISGSNPYKWAVTLPSLTAGQRCDMYITATIATIATAGVVASEQADTALVSEVKTETAAILADTGTDGVLIGATQGAITWAQQKIVADVAGEGALDIENSNIGGAGQHNKGGGSSAGLWNEATIGTLNDGGSFGLVNSGAQDVLGYDPALALEATLTAIKGDGWTNQTLAKIVTDIAAISAGSGATPQQIWEYATRVLTADAVAEIADAVWDEDILNAHQNQDSAGEVMSHTAANLSDAATIADAVWDEAISEHTTATTFGGKNQKVVPSETIGDYKADVSALATATNLAAVKSVADDILVDTGTTLPATLATLAGYTDGIAGDVWSHPTRTLTNQGIESATPASGDPLVIYRDTTVNISLTGLGAMGGYTKIWFTVKEDLEDLDTDAILQVEVTDGLKYLDGAAGVDSDGTLSIGDTTADIEIKQASAALLPVYAAYPVPWDLKMLKDSNVTILAQGTIYILSTPTRAIA